MKKQAGKNKIPKPIKPLNKLLNFHFGMLIVEMSSVNWPLRLRLDPAPRLKRFAS
ncbi:MAG: hypothetical protein ABI295_06035 [Xanthomarina sp.]